MLTSNVVVYEIYVVWLRCGWKRQMQPLSQGVYQAAAADMSQVLGSE